MTRFDFAFKAVTCSLGLAAMLWLRPEWRTVVAYAIGCLIAEALMFVARRSKGGAR